RRAARERDEASYKRAAGPASEAALGRGDFLEQQARAVEELRARPRPAGEVLLPNSFAGMAGGARLEGEPFRWLWCGVRGAWCAGAEQEDFLSEFPGVPATRCAF